MDDTSTIQQNIITSFGLDSLSEKEQTRVLDDIGKVIYQRVILRLLDVLSEEDKDAFDKMLGKKGNNQKIIEEFLTTKIPNLDTFVEEEIANFKSETQSFMDNVTDKKEN